MRKFVMTLAAMSTAFSLAAYVPAAEARPGHHWSGGGRHFAHNGGGRWSGGHGHGYWRGGRWIALGIGAAALAGAAGAYDDCYWRYGRRYCY